MSKYKILCIVNILLSSFFLFLLAKSGYDKEYLSSPYLFVNAYTPHMIFIVSLATNLFLSYKLLSQKSHTVSFLLYMTLTFSTLYWFLLLFIGFFFVSHAIFPLLSLILAICIFFLIRKSSIKIACALSLMSILISIVVILSNFEENYCWTKGAEADPTSRNTIIATKEDAENLKTFDVEEGAKIGIGFRTHMLCHRTFDLTKAIKEKYFSIH